MGKLIGLPGVVGGEISDVSFFRTVSDGMEKLRAHRAITTAGDNGAITVWRDDAGQFRCERSRFCIEQNSRISKTKAGVKAWLMQELSRID